jgi:hypothetical protein
VQIQQPLNRAAAIKQSQSRWFSTARRGIYTTTRQFSSTSSRASYPPSRTGRAISQLTSRAPFASTLRPNLTGGTLSRSAGGYGTGAGRIGGARYFSHTPTAPAQVINNVSQAVRAFWLSGQKARFDGVNPRTGEKRFRAVSTLQEEAHNKMNVSNSQAPGSYLDFKVNPTITALGPLSQISGSQRDETTLNCDDVMERLSIDFARALKDLAAIMNDLKKLAALGDLPISLANSTTLRVRFPGCDADLVEALCKELGIRRGLVYQDADFEARTGTEMALLFPFAPSKAPSQITCSPNVRSVKRQKRDHLDWQEMVSRQPSWSPHRSVTSHDFEDIEENPWLSPQSGYSSLHESEHGVEMYFEQLPSQHSNNANDFEGLEGIYRFLEECDRARR